MTRLLMKGWFAVLAVYFGAASVAGAQSTELSQAILSLPSQTISTGLVYDRARLFAGLVDATITDQTGDLDDFAGADVISFRVVPRDGTTPPTGIGFTAPFVGTRDQFERWARDNAGPLLRVLFPGGLSAAAGRDLAGLYSQQLMLTTILDANETQTRGRQGAGGLFETEWLRRDNRASGDSAWGTQGLYAFSRTLSVQGRFGRQQEGLRTAATSAAVDYHPFIERGTTTIVRIGGTARAGFLYSSSRSLEAAAATDPIRFGSLDVAGGGWASVRRRFARVTLGGGGLLQGTKSYVPPGDEGTFRAAIADALNDRGIAYDLTVGGTARFDATNTLSVIGRVAETYALESSIDRPAMHMLQGGVMYALAPGASIDVGYKVTSFGDMLGQSLFFQGNFGW